MNLWTANGTEILFDFLAVLMIVLGVLTVSTEHILRSAIYLMSVLFLSAGLYLMLGAEFLAGVQVLIYIGGIIVLLVFAVMLTRSRDLQQDQPRVHRKILAALASGGFFGVSSVMVLNSPIANSPLAVGTGDLVSNVTTASISTIGKALVDMGGGGYVLPFEVISVLLLGVLIGGSVVARRDK